MSEPAIPPAYLISFRTYGHWLHGDERWSVERGDAEWASPSVPPNRRLEVYESGRLLNPEVALDLAQRRCVDRTIREVCAYRGWPLHELNVRTNHIHGVVAAGCSPERVMNDWKSWCTRRLVEAGLVVRGSRVWARHGSTRYLWDAKAVEDASRYVRDAQGPDIT